MRTTNGERTEGRHPIGVVESRTGLTEHVLRAWERRYGAVEPARTKGGQRMYSDADIVRLRLLRRATEEGRTIGQVASLSTEALARLVGEAEPHAVSPTARAGAERFRAEALSAGERLAAGELHDVLMRAVVSLRPADFLSEVVGPLLADVGERWAEGHLRPAHEHVVSVSLRRVLDFLLDTFGHEPDAPVLVTGTLSGELHEFGALLAAVVAADEGWRVVYLGPSLPPEEIAAAAATTGAAAVAISVVYRPENWQVSDEMMRLREGLPEGTLLVVGGRDADRLGATAEIARATVLADLGALRPILKAVRDG